MIAELEDYLDQQELAEEDVAGLEHGAIGVRLISHLFSYVYANDLGEVFEAQTTFKFKGKRPKRQPDVSFVSKARLPANFRMEANFAPDLAIEIVSRNDKDFEIEANVRQYQKSGVRLIWIIHPYSQSVDVYRLASGALLKRFMGQNELDGEDVILGFRLKVSQLFENIPIIDEDNFEDEE